MVKCPRCKWNLIRPPQYALSRRDNFTKICPECGTAEALEDAGMRAKWEQEFPGQKPYWYKSMEVKR